MFQFPSIHSNQFLIGQNYETFKKFLTQNNQKFVVKQETSQFETKANNGRYRERRVFGHRVHLSSKKNNFDFYFYLLWPLDVEIDCIELIDDCILIALCLCFCWKEKKKTDFDFEWKRKKFGITKLQWWKSKLMWILNILKWWVKIFVFDIGFDFFANFLRTKFFFFQSIFFANFCNK